MLMAVLVSESELNGTNMWKIFWIWLAFLAGSVSSYSDYDLWIATRDRNLVEIENALSNRATIALKKADQAQPNSLWYKHGQGSTALHVASRYSYPQVVSAILDAGFDINVKDDSYKQSPLHVAGSEEVANMLIERGADLDVKDTYGYTPLIQAIVSDRLSVVKALLNANASVSIIEGDGLSALHIAALYNRPTIVELLLQNGADVNQVSSNGVGRTALELAKSNKHQDVVDILEQFIVGPPMDPQLKSILLTILIIGVIVIIALVSLLMYCCILRKSKAYNIQVEISRQIDSAKANTQRAFP